MKIMKPIVINVIITVLFSMLLSLFYSLKCCMYQKLRKTGGIRIIVYETVSKDNRMDIVV